MNRDNDNTVMKKIKRIKESLFLVKSVESFIFYFLIYNSGTSKFKGDGVLFTVFEIVNTVYLDNYK